MSFHEAAIAMWAVAALAIPAGAQSFLDHVENAKLLAAGDLAGRNLVDCSMPPQSAAPTGEPIASAEDEAAVDEDDADTDREDDED